MIRYKTDKQDFSMAHFLSEGKEKDVPAATKKWKEEEAYLVFFLR